MSEYGFGYEDPEFTPAAAEQSGDKAPKWYRERMDKVSEQLNQLVEENNRLKAAQQRSEVESALTKAGYAPQAAGLYQGDPAGLTDWLTANGAALAKLPGAPEGAGETEQGQAPQGPPQSVVSPEDQAALTRMQGMGAEGAAPPLGSEEQLVARLNAATTLEEYDAIMREAGNRF